MIKGKLLLLLQIKFCYNPYFTKNVFITAQNIPATLFQQQCSNVTGIFCSVWDLCLSIKQFLNSSSIPAVKGNYITLMYCN